MPSLTSSASSERLAGLDHLRAIAILMVFLFHYPNDIPAWLVKPYNFGWTGVDLFFVLSGYLIASQLFSRIKNGKDFSIKDFYIRRFFRIIPLYVLVLIIYFAYPGFSQRYGPSPWWKYLTFTQNIGLDPGKYPSFTHAWSLAVEEQFYLFFPLIIAALLYFKIFRRGIYLVPALFVTTFLLRYYVWTEYWKPLTEADEGGNFWVMWIYYPTHTRLDGLLVGIAIAALFEFVPMFKIRMSKYGNLFLMAGLAAIIGCYYLCLDRQSFNGSVWGFTAVAMAYGLIVVAALLPGCILYKIRSRITAGIAILSYSMYLIHKGTTNMCTRFFGKMHWDTNSVWLLITSLGVTILCALVLRYVVEKPFEKFRNNILAKKNSVALRE